MYFPNMKPQVLQEEIPVPDTHPNFVAASLINANTLGYTLEAPGQGYETNGVAYMQMGITSQDPFFGREEITLPVSEHRLETTILNFYTAYTVHA